MNIFEHIKEHKKAYCLLFFSFIISVLLFSVSFAKSKEYNKQKKNSTSVVGHVVKSEYKETTEIEMDPDGFTYESTDSYYQILSEYVYNSKTYTYTFKSETDYEIGKEIVIQINSANPEHVLDKNPSESYFVFGIITLLIFIGTIMYITLKGKLFFILFLLGAIGFLFGSISFLCNQMFGTALIFFIASIAFLLVSILFAKL